MVTRHVDIFWNVDFDSQTLSGEAVLQFDIVAKEIESIVRYFETLYKRGTRLGPFLKQLITFFKSFLYH